MLSPMDEIRFWTGIMRDHGEFILTSLSFNEREAIEAAQFYKESFSRLHEQVKRIAQSNDIDSMNLIIRESLKLLVCFINFKRLLLRRSLQCKLSSSLPPTFYNHMINEAMQFYQVLIIMQCGKPVNPLLENLELHNIWLPDAAGHAASIACDLDPIEKLLIAEAQEFERVFNQLTIKADELSKMLIRSCLADGVLKHFNNEVKEKILAFICYLNKIRELRAGCKILGTLKPLIPDHMIREETYYFYKIEAYD